MELFYLAHLVPEPFAEKVMQWKLFMREHYGCEVALRSPAHITMVPPFRKEAVEELRMIEQMERWLHGNSFPLCTNGFSAFPPRTLYIALRPQVALAAARDRVAEVFEKEFGVVRETRPFHPHITIATRDLKQTDFESAWQLLKEKKFSVEWTASSCTLLRKGQKKWEVVHTSHLP